MRPSEALAKHRDEVLAIIARYPVTNPRIFGSVARGDDVEGSDVDILCELLGVPVEVFTKLNDQAARTASINVRPI